MKTEYEILIVDDDPDDILLFQEAMMKTGACVNVLTANCGKDCLKTLDQFGNLDKLSAIILDFNMHDMTGAEVLLKLRNYPLNNALLVVWSTSSSPLYQQLSKDNGAEHYFVKPDNFNKTIELCKSILRLIDKERE